MRAVPQVLQLNESGCAAARLARLLADEPLPLHPVRLLHAGQAVAAAPLLVELLLDPRLGVVATALPWWERGKATTQCDNALVARHCCFCARAVRKGGL